MYELNFPMNGPFKLVGDTGVLSMSDNSCGVYIFTIKIKDDYVIEYVGITLRPFKVRFLEHVKELLSGGYQVYNFDKLRAGKANFVEWPGRFGSHKKDIVEFISDYKNKSSFIHKQINELEIFLIPIDTKDRRLLERIEHEIYVRLKKANYEPTKTFICDVRSNKPIEGEKPLLVKINSNIKLIPSVVDYLELKDNDD